MDFQNRATIRIAGTQLSIPSMTPAEIEIVDALFGALDKDVLAVECRAAITLAHFIQPSKREATSLLVKLAYLRAMGWQHVEETA